MGFLCWSVCDSAYGLCTQSVWGITWGLYAGEVGDSLGFLCWSIFKFAWSPCACQTGGSALVSVLIRSGVCLESLCWFGYMPPRDFCVSHDGSLQGVCVSLLVVLEVWYDLPDAQFGRLLCTLPARLLYFWCFLLIRLPVSCGSLRKSAWGLSCSVLRFACVFLLVLGVPGFSVLFMLDVSI